MDSAPSTGHASPPENDAKLGRVLLASLIELPNTSLSALADYYKITPSRAVRLVCQALQEL